MPLEIDGLPAYSFAILQSGRLPVRRLRPAPAPGSSGDLVGATLVIPELGCRVMIRDHHPDGSIDIDAAARGPLGAILDEVVQRTPARLQIHRGDAVLAETRVTVLPTWSWPHFREARLAAATFVLPGEEAISRVLTEAAVDLTPDPGAGTRPSLTAEAVLARLYRHLIDRTSIAYETPRVHVDDWSGQSGQDIRPPHEILFTESAGRGNCIDLSLFLASCLEGAGLSPLIVFVGDMDSNPAHAFVGCWTEPGTRFRPFLTNREDLRRRHESGELLLLEATGVCRGDKRLSFADALRAGAAHLDDKSALHALDVGATRPPVNAVRPVRTPDSEAVRRAVRIAHHLARDRKLRSYETIHLLYGLCRAGGEATRWLMDAVGARPDAVVSLMESGIRPEAHEGSPVATRNYRLCFETARNNARSALRDAVTETDLWWAILDNPSRNVGRIMSSVGCDRARLKEFLSQKYPAAGNTSILHNFPAPPGGAPGSP